MAKITAPGVKAMRHDVQTSAADQIPTIAKNVAEHCNGAIGLMARRFFKGDTRRQQPRMICGKIIGLQEQPDPPCALIADRGGLPVVRRLGQYKARAAARRCDPDPTFVPLINIFIQNKPHLPAVKGNGGVIVGDNQGQGRKAHVTSVQVLRPMIKRLKDAMGQD